MLLLNNVHENYFGQVYLQRTRVCSAPSTPCNFGDLRALLFFRNNWKLTCSTRIRASSPILINCYIFLPVKFFSRQNEITHWFLLLGINCTALSQSELQNDFMYIITTTKIIYLWSWWFSWWMGLWYLEDYGNKHAINNKFIYIYIYIYITIIIIIIIINIYIYIYIKIINNQ